MHDKQGGNFCYTRSNFTHRDRAKNRKEKLLYYFTRNTKENRYLKSTKLLPQGYSKVSSILRWYQSPPYGTFKNHHRKLLTYSDKTDHEHSIKDKQLHESNSQLDNIGVNDFFRKTKKDTEDDGELWDNWGNWSTCSVSCGSGRQVRWRHCLGGECSKGLKRAQIKTCKQKQCDSKTILRWLGIKS